MELDRSGDAVITDGRAGWKLSDSDGRRDGLVQRPQIQDTSRLQANVYSERSRERGAQISETGEATDHVPEHPSSASQPVLDQKPERAL